jgi:hypothetical protein
MPDPVTATTVNELAALANSGIGGAVVAAAALMAREAIVHIRQNRNGGKPVAGSTCVLLRKNTDLQLRNVNESLVKLNTAVQQVDEKVSQLQREHVEDLKRELERAQQT